MQTTKTCKYRDCNKEAAYKGFCTPSHKTQYYRDRASVTPAPDQSVTPAPVTPQSVTPTVTPEPINWADPDADYSTIARKTDGQILVPGDPGYSGVCRQDADGQWSVPRAAVL